MCASCVCRCKHSVLSPYVILQKGERWFKRLRSRWLKGWNSYRNPGSSLINKLFEREKKYLMEKLRKHALLGRVQLAAFGDISENAESSIGMRCFCFRFNKSFLLTAQDKQLDYLTWFYTEWIKLGLVLPPKSMKCMSFLMPERFRGLIYGKGFPEAYKLYKLCFFFFFSRINIKPLIGMSADKGENTFNRKISLAFIWGVNIIKILWEE